MPASPTSPVASPGLYAIEPISDEGFTIKADQPPEGMREWLIRMINSGRFAGLDWLDEDKTIFKVPCIHAEKRGYNREQDEALFREWAMHSGKYRQDSDPHMWKINFWCAIFRLKDIMEIKDMQTEDCRVYKVLPSRHKMYRPKVSRQRVEPYPASYTIHAENMDRKFEFFEQQIPSSIYANPVASTHSISSVHTSSSDSGVSSLFPSPYESIPGSTTTSDIFSDIPLASPKFATPYWNHLQIQVFYESIPVLTEQLNCKHGCRIISSNNSISPEEMKTIFPEGMKTIVLPDNHPQALARDIFDDMQHGILIEASDGNVYVTPFCRPVVYCANSPTDMAQPLGKEVRSKVFDYRNQFRPALEGYNPLAAPTAFFILGLGQNWGGGRHVTQNLISIVITHVQAKHEIDAVSVLSAVDQPSSCESFTNTKSSDSTNIMPAVSDHSHTSIFPIPPKQSPRFREAQERVLVPFLFHHVLQCDCNGQQYTIEDHDITLRIPKGAVSEGEIVHFEIGVAAYGPFHFPEKTQPISPIVWVCLLEEGYELKKPFQLTVPHTVTQLSEDKIRCHEASFAKANHNDQFSLNNVVTYKFNHCDIEPFFTSIGRQSYGVLLANHFCFYCLKAKQTAELAVDAGYSLVRVETSLTPQRHEIYFCAIFLLKTCLKSLEEQFLQEEGYQITSCRDFKFSADSDTPFIEVVAPSRHECCNVIAMEPMVSKIKVSDMDFWSKGIENMQLRHERKMYPPRVKMTVSMKCLDLAFKLPIKFSGCSTDSQLDTELAFPLGLPVTGTSSSSSSSGSSSSLYADSQSSSIKCGPPELADVFRQLLSISKDWKNIGTLLWIPSGTLDKIETEEQDVHSRLREMLTQWLKSDHKPTWNKLVDAVKPFDPSKAEQLSKQYRDYPTS